MIRAKTGAICLAKALKMLGILRGQLTFVQHADKLCSCNSVCPVMYIPVVTQCAAYTH